MHQSVSSEDTNTETTTFTNILTDPNTIPTPPSNSTTDTTTHSTDNTNNNTIATDNTQSSVDSLEVEQEEVFDPQSIVRDILEDDRSGRNLRLGELYNQEKANLIGTSVNTSAGLSWTVRNDVLHSEVVDEYDSLVGVRNFDFNNKRIKTAKGLVRINFLDLLIHLWPGDWRAQLTELNQMIHKEYKEKVRNTRHGHVKKVHEITKQEFWVFMK